MSSFPTIEFALRDGKRVTVKMERGMLPLRLREGSTARVKYNADDHMQVVLAASRAWLVALALVCALTAVLYVVTQW